jgi:hypothetical protein
MMQDYNQAAAYVVALTGEPVETAAMWWRCIHDTDKTVAAHKYYGTLSSVWQTLCDYNSRGYGIFANINAFAPDVQDHTLANIWYVRTHVVDLDKPLTSAQNYQLAAAFSPTPAFAVGTSPGKYHIYWPVNPYQGNDRCTLSQRRLRQLFDGDASIVDASRVLRVPGFLHLKDPANPHMVTCWSLDGTRGTVEALEAATAHVNVIDSGGGRHALGEPSLAAPSLDWLRFGLSLIDPNQLDRAEWISTTAAIKQAGWTLADEPTLRAIWDEWCGRYTGNDAGENDKQWRSIRETEVGWKSLYRRAPSLVAYEKFGFDKTPAPTSQPLPAPGEPQPLPCEDVEQLPDILSEYDCQKWFKDCYFIEQMGKILTPGGRFMNATQFNGTFGGKLFIITPDGKTTDEAWKAATRSTLWTIPKVDHIRFLPEQPTFTIIDDQLGRKGVNTYIPIRLTSRRGDIGPFLRHVQYMLPIETDRQIIYSYLAHNVQYPGFKIPWAPMVQSAEGVGKGFIQEAIALTLGEMYTYSPKADELVNSGSKFNAWMRNKLMIIVNEIKVDERRELIEILKPMISDKRIEIQGKGADQEMEDNPANWLLFSNYKDAIPVNKNGRRYSIFYSAIQSNADRIACGMDDAYFNGLFAWLHSGGNEIIADWLLNYPIERGAIPMRAPETSSQQEAVKVSRGPVEVAIVNAVEDGLAGFRGGYVSTLAVLKRLREVGVRQPAQSTVHRILEGMGYFEIGRAPRAFGQESMLERTTVFAIMRELPVAAFGRVQGYE